MKNANANAGRKRPPITLIDKEAETLADLALAVQDRLPQVSELLLQEIERARICRPDKVPAGTVTMMSRVIFEDEGTGARREIQLVFPKDADAEAGRISILTPIGAGLIGMRAGNSIQWPDAGGRLHLLKILEVVQPEAAIG